jgi:DNA-binding XRE family transcriptional regulator
LTKQNEVFIIINIIRLVDEMKKAVYNILPKTEEILKTMGEQIKLARLRRSLSAELVAERAGISRASLWKVEKGDPSVAMGIYAAVLHALNNLDQDLLLIAKDDELGRQLQDLNLITRKRAPRRSD